MNVPTRMQGYDTEPYWARPANILTIHVQCTTQQARLLFDGIGTPVFVVSYETNCSQVSLFLCTGLI